MVRTSLFVALAFAALPAPAIAQSGVAERWKAAITICNGDDTVLRARFTNCSTAIEFGADPASGATADDMYIAYMVRSRVHIAMNDYTNAIADADSAAGYVEKSADVHQLRCWTRALANVELDIATAACARSFEIAWSYTDTYNARGLLNMRLENWEAAYKDFSEIAERRFRAYAQYSAGLARIGMGDISEGEELIRKSLWRDRTAGDLLNSLGYTPDYMKSIGANN